MRKELRAALESLEHSGNSASIAVADHLQTVASNGPSYATKGAMHEEARAVIAAARAFLADTGGTDETQDDLDDLRTAARAVVDNWETGDLAGAVHDLEMELPAK